MLRAAAVFVVSFAAIFPQEGGAPRVIERAPGETILALAQRVIPQDHELAHAPVELQFGPAGKHIVILHAPKDETKFSGIVLVAGTKGLRRYDIPGPQGIPGQFEYHVEAVLAENADRDPGRELIVLYSYHRNGSTSDDGNACLVYRWDGNSFQPLKPAAARLAGAKTAGQIRARLRADSGGNKAVSSKRNSRGTEK